MDLKRWLLAGTSLCVLGLVVVGVIDERIDLTSVALGLITFMGLLANSIHKDSTKDES